MAQVLIKPEQNAAVQMHRELGPFEHLLWLVDQWTPRNFALVCRIEGSPVSVESLGAALLQVQHRHPILRTAIHVNGDGSSYEGPYYPARVGAFRREAYGRNNLRDR